MIRKNNYGQKSMFGWLKKKIEKRTFEKQVDTIWKVFGVSQDLREQSDNGKLRSFNVDGDITELNGFEEEVSIVRTKDGVIILKKSNGEQISNSLLKDDVIKQIPPDVTECVFAYFIVRSKHEGYDDKICSCLIDSNGSDVSVYGDRRAFWWSLAKGSLKEIFLKINNTRMTDKAFAQVRASANGVWQSAIDHDGSIEHMRDTIVLCRNTHLDVFSKLKTQYENNPSVKFGIDIAKTMVLATQSEDLKLEGIAFERLKSFIWESGKEPKEFIILHG